MSKELESILPLPLNSSSSWLRIWLTALTRPSVATYQELARLANVHPRDGWIWLFGSSLLSGLLVSLAPLIRQSGYTLDGNLALAILLFAMLAMLIWIIFTGCVHGIVHLFRGVGAYPKLLYSFATFSTPLILLASVLALIPHTRSLQIGLYLYWLVLYQVSIQAVYQISRVTAIASLLISLILLGGAVVGIGVWAIS